MWNWDQGRLEYFQFDSLKKIAKVAVNQDLKKVDRKLLALKTGLPYLPNNDQYPPWRNYRRVFALSLICTEHGRSASQSTKVARLLADDGNVTADEYYHFLCRASTDPSPALAGWDYTKNLRYPLLFSLKYMLTRCALGEETTEISKIVAAYDNPSPCRQAKESIRIISQISYLALSKKTVTVSLSAQDALEIFNSLVPLNGKPYYNGSDEILRITNKFDSEINRPDLNYSNTAMNNAEAAGFSENTVYVEGKKARKTHLVIERNRKIRKDFFDNYPTTVCDMCRRDTAQTYPWVTRILDLHHLLPLCSGAQTTKNGTVLEDMVAICPTCHFGVHRYYSRWLKYSKQKDFADADQAKAVYDEIKKEMQTVE